MNKTNKITYDFEIKMLCNFPQSGNYKTIEYNLYLYAWFYIYENDFKYVEDPDDEEKIKNILKNGKMHDTDYDDYYTDDNEYCTAYKYIYSLNREEVILYKIVPYSCDWVINPDCE